MTVLELCEPVFEYICRLNRMARSSASADYGIVRAELKAMLAESRLKFAGQWHQNRLAYERKELAGDEKFFDLLEESMQDNSEEAAERLAFYYTCIGLGFTGMYSGQPEYLRKTMMTIAPRIRHRVDSDQTARICPEAYTGVD